MHRWQPGSRLLSGVLFTTCLCSVASAQLVVQGVDTSQATARQLATQLAPGVPIVSASLTGASAAAGTFSGGTSAGLDLDQGVILSSGRVTDAVGPNSAPDQSTDWGQVGSDPLSQILGVDTLDAASLTFRFTCPASARSVRVDYVFASEEYEGFDDPAALFVYDGAAIVVDGVNAALLPGGIPLSAPALPLWAPGAFRDNNACNEAAETPCPYNLQADGFSSQFIARAPINPAAGSHQVEIVIGDHLLADLDSWIFLRSFTCSTDSGAVPAPSLGSAGALWLAAALLTAGGTRLRRRTRPALRAQAG